MTNAVNVRANRKAQKWTRREQFGRMLWGIASPLFRLSPRQLWGLRNVMLRIFGARVGREVCVYPTVRITIPWNVVLDDYCAVGDRVTLYALGQIRVGARATVSQGAHICAGTHDWRDLTMPLLKPPIEIGEDVWICADAFVGPGVRVGSRAIVGARAVVMKDVLPDVIVVGNPAREVGKRRSEGTNSS